VTAVHRGFDGKLPSRGDFVGRGLPRSFLGPWRAWVDASLVASRTALGEAWLAAWLEAPIWHFALPGGVCGPDAVLGLIMPSIDRAGRHYPLTVAAVFVGMSAAPSDLAWLDAVELVALKALTLDQTPDTLEQSLHSVPAPVRQAGAGSWWTAGSPRVPETRLAAGGLPDPRDFAAMIDAAAVP
jgi:type VI secretion system protein ImpM